MERKIPITNGIGIQEQRHLLEITSYMAAALTEDEFLEIAKVYDKAINRLLKSENEGVS